jgi:hypothetical protein
MWLNLLLAPTLPLSICEYFYQSSFWGNSIGTSGFAEKLSVETTLIPILFSTLRRASPASSPL